MSGLRGLLKRLDAHPDADAGRRACPQLTEGWASLGIAQAMYDQGSWGTLTDALREVVNENNGTELMQLADQYADRNPSGRYTGNLLEAFYAISCLDNPDSAGPGVYEKQADRFASRRPSWGPFLAWSSHGRAATGRSRPPTSRPAQDQRRGQRARSSWSARPATRRRPTSGRCACDQQLANARLLTFDGDGHTAYTRSNKCIDNAIDDYYVKKTVPQDGLKC